MKKPTLGIKPKWLWLEQFEKGVIISVEEIGNRFYALGETIKRRIDNSDNLLIEWIEEYNDIIKWLERQNNER